MFIMKHHPILMEASTSTRGEVWFVDSRASNHMTNHVDVKNSTKIVRELVLEMRISTKRGKDVELSGEGER